MRLIDILTLLRLVILALFFPLAVAGFWLGRGQRLESWELPHGRVGTLGLQLLGLLVWASVAGGTVQAFGLW